MDLHLKFQRGDGWAIAAVLAMAVCILALFASGVAGEESAQLMVYQNGSLIRRFPLEENTVFQIDGPYHNVIAIRDGRAAITASDCPGEDCVHSGWIDAPGRSIVCLPNRVELRIRAARDVDFAVG